MIPTILLLSAAVASDPTAVNSVSVVPVADRTEIVIQVDGHVSVTDFALGDPDRIVVDLAGAHHALPRDRFEVGRGGVRIMRSSQFRPGVVRLVFELDGPARYTVRDDPGQVRVSIANPGADFDPWHSAGSAAAVIPSPRAEAPAPASASNGARRSEQPRIYVFFKDAPIRDVLTTFAEFSGRSIVAGARVDGRVTADIKDQPWDIALDAILDSHGLAAREERSGILRVETITAIREREREDRDREAWADLETRQFRIRYARVDTIIPAVRGLLSEHGKVTSAATTNTLIVTDRRSILDRITPMIEQLDVRAPQVTIAARIIFIDRTKLRQYGIAYDLKDMRGDRGNRINTLFATEGDDADIVVTLQGESIAALANANIPLPRSTLQVVTSVVLGRHSLITFLEALQELQLSETHASPTITTLSHREAHVLVGERTPIRVIDVGTATGGQGVQPRATVDLQETGVLLRTTPHVTGNQILLELHAENSQLALAPSDIGFTFQTQESTTQVLLDDGETSVISGLTIVERDRVRTGIPILMDIPVFGHLFSSTLDRETHKDLLIMVTPYIVQNGTP